MQPADEETVDPDQLARPGGLDVRLGLRRARRLKRRAVAGDQRQPPRTRVEPVSDERLIDAVGADDQPAPLRARQARRDPFGPEPRMPQPEGHDPLLDNQRELVGHARAPALAGPEHLQSLARPARPSGNTLSDAHPSTGTPPTPRDPRPARTTAGDSRTARQTPSSRTPAPFCLAVKGAGAATRTAPTLSGPSGPKHASLSPTTVGRTWSQFSLGWVHRSSWMPRCRGGRSWPSGRASSG